MVTKTHPILQTKEQKEGRKPKPLFYKILIFFFCDQKNEEHTSISKLVNSWTSQWSLKRSGLTRHPSKKICHSEARETENYNLLIALHGKHGLKGEEGTPLAKHKAIVRKNISQ